MFLKINVSTKEDPYSIKVDTIDEDINIDQFKIQKRFWYRFLYKIIKYFKINV